MLDRSEPGEQAPREQVPSGWEEGAEVNPESGTGWVTTDSMPADAPPPTDWDPVLEEWGIDTSLYMVDETRPIEWRGWNAMTGKDRGNEVVKMKRFRCYLRLRSSLVLDAADIDALVKRVRSRKPAKTKRHRENVGLVLGLSDWQIGKAQGGTPATVDAIRTCLDQVTDYVADVKPQHLHLAGLGDTIEGCGQGWYSQAGQDLDRRGQMLVARELGWEFIQRFAHVPEVTFSSVPSNHGENRGTKGAPMTDPARDNADLELLDQLAMVAAQNPDTYGHVRFVRPPDSDPYVTCVDVAGARVGTAHGHQISGHAIAGTEKWWREQMGGENPVQHCNILMTGHRHHFATSEGVGPRRLIVQSPAMDGGSEHFTARRGTRSHRGMVSGLVGAAMGERMWGDILVHQPSPWRLRP